ncbi:MAG: tetratricopeptide repeat protein [Syntrophaceae bacterium]|nr:tetratricopeptide repeat protein [Syntrophaceae bacterium]
MKRTKNKTVFILIMLIMLFLLSCTFTPWHREQSESFLNKGISFLSAGQYNSALKELLEAEKYHSGNPKVHYYLGIAYHGKGMIKEAVEEFEEAISLDDNYSEAHNYLGTLYSERKLWDKAIQEFEKALRNHLYDTPSMALYNMAWAYYSKKDYHMALVKYQEALKVEPMTRLRPLIEKNIGLIYYDQSYFSEAIKHFKKSVELDSSLVDAYYLLGQSYLKNKDDGNARGAFQNVIQLSPDSPLGLKAKNYLQSLK